MSLIYCKEENLSEIEKLQDDEGTNNWVANPNGRDLRLIEKMPPTEVASLIENYMMHQPSIK